MRIFHVDSFTAEPFTGNPAAVCLLDGPEEPSWMQAVAAEMNLSETAFVERRDDGFNLRWFTPVQEADLCGHATLAAAHVLWEEGEPASRLCFDTRSGILTAARSPDGAILLDFPAEPVEQAAAPPAGLAAALGADPVWVGCNRLEWFWEVADAAAVRGLRPDFAGVAAACLPLRGVVVTARSDLDRPGADFVSRCFGPATGIDEDPVTGSSHCGLGPLWGERLGKSDLVGYQASARGGYVGVRLAGDRVVLSGQAVTVTRGELLGNR